MPQLISFTFCSLNGVYKGPQDDISWHQHGAEESEYSEQQLASGNYLLFGRRTYEMMADFWSSPTAFASYPAIARGMQQAKKLVVSGKLQKVGWENTRLLQGDWLSEIRALKKKHSLTLLGSGSLHRQLAAAGLIDEYQLLIDPIVLPEGTPLFQAETLNLQLLSCRALASGSLLLRYGPVPTGSPQQAAFASELINQQH